MRENNNKLVPFLTKSLKETYIFATHNAAPSFMGMIRYIFRALRKPFMAAKAAVYRNPATQPVVKQSNWMPIVLIVIGGTVLMYKDLNFNFNLSSTPPANGGAGIVNAVPAGATSQPMNFQEVGLVSDAQNEKNRAYLRQYSQLAINEMNAYGIPASVSLGLGLMKSQGGGSSAATLYNNHFAIKCYSRQCKKGHCGNLEEMGHKSFFRKYSKAEDSWRAHSLMTTTGKYRDLARSRDYRTWATGLQEKGYFTSQNQAEELIKVIEHYGLEQLDKK